MPTQHSHCSYCGHAFAETPWPRACAACGHLSYLNPLPVSVLLVPVDDGLLCVRRGVAPRMGQLALPGGFINAGEAWQTAAVREVEEETGLRLNAENVRLFDALSAPDGTVLIFGVSEGVGLNQLPPFAPTSETSERVVIAAPIELAFPLHTRVMQAYFAARR